MLIYPFLLYFKTIFNLSHNFQQVIPQRLLPVKHKIEKLTFGLVPQLFFF